MTAEQLREVREAVPFQPFRIHTTHGRMFYVPHRDYLSVSPDERAVCVWTDRAASVLNIALIGELELNAAPNVPRPVG